MLESISQFVLNADQRGRQSIVRLFCSVKVNFESGPVENSKGVK